MPLVALCEHKGSFERLGMIFESRQHPIVPFLTHAVLDRQLSLSV